MNNMIICHYCGVKINSYESHCPYCYSEIKYEKKDFGKHILIALKKQEKEYISW